MKIYKVFFLISIMMILAGCNHFQIKPERIENCFLETKAVLAQIHPKVSEVKKPDVVVLTLKDLRSMYRMIKKENLKSKAFYLKVTNQVFITGTTPPAQVKHEMIHHLLNESFPEMTFDMHHLIIHALGY